MIDSLPSTVTGVETDRPGMTFRLPCVRHAFGGRRKDRAAWIEKRFVDSPTQLEAVISASLPRGSTRLRCGGESLATSTPASDSCYQIDTVEQAMHASIAWRYQAGRPDQCAPCQCKTRTAPEHARLIACT